MAAAHSSTDSAVDDAPLGASDAAQVHHDPIGIDGEHPVAPVPEEHRVEPGLGGVSSVGRVEAAVEFCCVRGRGIWLIAWFGLIGLSRI